MPRLNIADIKLRARDLLLESPDGMRWGDLVHSIENASRDTPNGTIVTALHQLMKESSDITKVKRGLYVLTDRTAASGPNQSSSGNVDAEVSVQTSDGDVLKLRESSFYKPVAEWLIELEEVSTAEVVGGNALGGKWGTPDIIGVLKPSAADYVKFDLQIVSAEVKIDPNQPVVAFGQAVSYRLFSHKSYVVMPSTLSGENYDRLEALCILHGIGLATYDLTDGSPNFSLRVRAQTVQPDMFYVNQMAKRLHDQSPRLFKGLF